MSIYLLLYVERECGILNCGITLQKVKNGVPLQLIIRKNTCKLTFTKCLVQRMVAHQPILISLCRLDGIVLSPQGRSFVRGCQVNVQDGGDARNKLGGRLGRGWDVPARDKGRGRGRVGISLTVFSLQEFVL